jgi:hypothetical protein
MGESGARAAERAIASLEVARNELRGVVGPLSTEHALQIRYLLDHLGVRVGALAEDRLNGRLSGVRVQSSAEAAVEPPLTLLTLPPEVLAHIISHLEAPADYLTLVRVCWQLRGLPAPRVVSPVECAVRERSTRHGVSVPSELAQKSSSWLHTLLQPERERQALVRCSPLAASEFHSAAVSSAGQLLVWGLLPDDERVELANSEAGLEFPLGAIDGLLGTPMRPYETMGGVLPRVVPGLANVRIRAVATGHVHTLAVSCKVGAVGEPRAFERSCRAPCARARACPFRLAPASASHPSLARPCAPAARERCSARMPSARAPGLRLTLRPP